MNSCAPAPPIIPTSDSTTWNARPARRKIRAVGLLLPLVSRVEARLVNVERVGVLHPELARSEHARPGACFVALLRLDLVPHLRQLAIRADVLGGQPGHDLLVRHSEAHVAAVAVLEPEHLVLDVVPAARLLPELRRVEHRHRDLLAADRVHLLPDDGIHLVDRALAERQVDVDPRRELANETGADHEPVAGRLGVRGILSEGRDERRAPAHGLAPSGRGVAAGAAGAQCDALATTFGPGRPGR